MKLLFLIITIIVLLTTGCESNGTEPVQDLVQTNNFSISNAVLGSPNTSQDYRMITFDLNWTNCQRGANASNNWDAAVIEQYR